MLVITDIIVVVVPIMGIITSVEALGLRGHIAVIMVVSAIIIFIMSLTDLIIIIMARSISLVNF